MRPWSLRVVPENEDDRRMARILLVLLVASGIVYLVTGLITLSGGDWRSASVMGGALVFQLTPLWLLRRGRLQASALTLVTTVLIAVTASATFGQGIRDIVVVAYPIVFVIAGLTLNRRLFALCVGLTLAATTWLALGEAHGWFVTQPFFDDPSNLIYLTGLTIVLLAGVLAVHLLATNVRRSLGQAREELSERKKAEQAARESERRLSRVLETTSDGIYNVDLRTGATYYSPGYASMLGYGPTEVVLTPGSGAWESLLHPDDREGALRALDRCLSGEAEYYDMEFRLRTKAGDWRWIESRARVVERDPAGNSLRLIGSHRDITERRRAEQALRENESRFRAFVEQAPVAIGVFDLAGHGLFANRGFLETLGLSEIGEMIGRPAFEYFAPPFQEESKERTRCRLQGLPVPREYESIAMRADGTEFPVHLAIAPIQLSDETISIAFLTDITERKKAEEALRASEFQYAALVESAMDGIVILQDGIVRFVNSASTSLLGYSREELVGTQFLQHVAPEFHETVIQRYAERIAGADATAIYEIALLRKNATRLPVEVNATRVLYGDAPAVLAFLRDISERALTKAELERIAAQYREAQKMAHVGHWTYDPKTRRFLGSPEANRIYGFPEDVQPTFEELFTCVSKRDVERVKGALSSLIQEGRSLDEEMEIRPRNTNGSRVARTIAQVMADAQGEAALVYGTVQDITELRRTEQALSEREQTLGGIVESSRDWIWSLDLEGRHTYCNPAVGEILGYTPDELVGQSSLELLHPEDRTYVEGQLLDRIREKHGWRSLVLRWRHKNSTYRWLESNAVPIFDTAGELVGFRGVDRDITERREAEQQTRSALQSTIQAVAGIIETRDPYTSGHQDRVTKLAVAIARRLDLPDEQVDGVRVAATLHDIGKMSIPAEILSKPGKLSEQEFGLIREHPKVAHAILKGIAFPWPVADIILQHHERLDGTGYPSGLMGEQIRLEARIIAVADVVEAMSNHRPYRPALGVEAALAEIKQNSGVLYDATVVERCVTLFESEEFTLNG